MFKVYYLNKETGRLSASTASVFLDRDVGMGGLLMMATLVAAYGGTRIPPENGVLLAPLFALIGVAFVAANLALVAFSRFNANLNGQVMVFFIVTVAAAEVAVGLALIVALYRKRGTAHIEDLTSLKL